MAIDQTPFLLVDPNFLPSLTKDGWMSKDNIRIEKSRLSKILGEHFQHNTTEKDLTHAENDDIEMDVIWNPDKHTVKEITVRVSLRTRPASERLHKIAQAIDDIASSFGLMVFDMSRGLTLATEENIVDAIKQSRAGKLYYKEVK